MKVFFHGFFDDTSDSMPKFNLISDKVKEKIMTKIATDFDKHVVEFKKKHIYNSEQGYLKGFINCGGLSLVEWNFRPIAKIKYSCDAPDGFHIFCEPTPAFREMVKEYEREENNIKMMAVLAAQSCISKDKERKNNNMPFNFNPSAPYFPRFAPVPEVKRIIYNNPATIVFWKDGTKTVVKMSETCKPKEKFNKYHAFCAALAKKIYGNNSRVNAIVAEGFDQTAKKTKKTVKKETKTNG